jgi:hypothetical protein
MFEATGEAITTASEGNPDAAYILKKIELTPERIEYVGANEVLVTLKTKTGAPVTYTLTTASLVKSVNLSVALINGFTAKVLRDLGVL